MRHRRKPANSSGSRKVRTGGKSGRDGAWRGVKSSQHCRRKFELGIPALWNRAASRRESHRRSEPQRARATGEVPTVDSGPQPAGRVRRSRSARGSGPERTRPGDDDADRPIGSGSTAEIFDDPAKATVGANDHGLVVGDGVFEALKVTAAGPFALRRHLERMTARPAAMDLPDARTTR